MEKQGSGSTSQDLQCVGRLEIESPKPVGFLCGSIHINTDEAFHDFTSAALVCSSDTVRAPRYQMISSETNLNTLPTLSSTPDKVLPVTPVESRFREEALSQGGPITSNLTRKGEALAVSGVAECGDEIDVIGQTHVRNIGPDIEGGEKLIQMQNHQTKPKNTDDTTTTRNTMWSHAEDLALISAFMQMSPDDTIGKKQKFKGFFKKVDEKYKEVYLGGMTVGLNPRTADSLRGRWTRMKEEVNAFVLAFDEASRLVENRSGHNEDDTLKSALQLYRASHKKQQDFKLLHAWTSLKEYPEWEKKMNQHHPKAPVGTMDDPMKECGGSGSKRFRLSEDSVESCKRPIGLDKAKIAQKVAVEKQASASSLRDLQCVGRLKIESLKPVGFLCESIPVTTDEAIQDFTSAALVPPSDKVSARRYQMISSERDLYTLPTLSSTPVKVLPVTPVESRSREEAPLQGGPIILNLTSKGEWLAVSGLAEYHNEIDVMGKTLVLNTRPDIEEGEKLIQRQNHQTKPKNTDDTTTTRNTMWSHAEDLALMAAFMQMSQDATIGKKQTYKGFFKKVEEKYKEIRLGGMIVGLSPRTADSLRGRWTRMMEDVNALILAFNEASRLFKDRSCHNEDDILKSALQLYRSSHKKQQDFKLLHAWTSLTEYPEWEKKKDQYYPKAPVGTTDDPMEESGGSRIKRFRLSQDNVESCKRPICLVKAKCTQKVVAVEKQASADLQCIRKLEILSPKPVGFLYGSIPVTTDEAFHEFTSAGLVRSSDTVSAPRYQMISSERDLYTLPVISSTPDKVLPVTPVESRSREEAPSQGGSIMSKSDHTSKGEALAVSGLAEYQDEIDMMGQTPVLNTGPDIEEGEKLFQRQNHHTKPKNTIDTTTTRNTMWSHSEDLALISAFMQMSQDATIGEKKTYKGFFKKVEEKYKEIRLGGMIVGLSPRTADSLRGRWTRMMEDVNAFISAFDEASRLVENRSCHNEDGILKSALQLYSASHKKQHNFKLLHAWTSLKEYPDWEKKMNRYHPKAPVGTTDDPMEDSGGTMRFRLSEDNVESRERPMGLDKAKSAQKGATSSNSHMDNISEGSASFTNSYPAHLELSCKKLQFERERLEYKKLQLEQKKLDYLCSKMDAETEVQALKAQAQKELAEAQIAAAKVTKMGLLVQLSQFQNQDKLSPEMLALLEALKEELFP